MIKGLFCTCCLPISWYQSVLRKPSCACIKRYAESRSCKAFLYLWRQLIFIGGYPPLTLSQWSSSGNPVAIQCAWNLDPSVHWNATGEKLLVASVLPVVFQWSFSGFPVVFQCVPNMQSNAGSPLGHHWALASASVVPVASQCTCGSSGLPVCSNYAN